MCPHLFELALQTGYALPNFAAIDLELGFARTPQPYPSDRSGTPGAAARLARKVGPRTRQARESVLILRQFDLKGSLARLSMLGENIQNQRGAIHHTHGFSEDLLELALMTWRELVVKEDHIRQAIIGEGFDLLNFA
jgi:hypothetical protein